MHDLSQEQAEEYIRTGSYTLIIYNLCSRTRRVQPELNQSAKEVRNKYIAEGEDLSLYRAVCEFGRCKACNSRYSSFGFALINKDFAKWIHVEEHDGYESVEFGFYHCIVDRLKEILGRNGAITDEEFEAVKKSAEDVKIYII